METTNTLHAVAELFLAVYPHLKHLVNTQFSREFEDETTFSLIRTLGKLSEKSLTLSQVAELRNITRAGASLQVQALVERGWVRRLPDPADRRSALLEMTNEGRTHWLEVRQALVDNIAEVFQRLSAEEVAALETAFMALQRVLEQVDSGKDA